MSDLFVKQTSVLKKKEDTTPASFEAGMSELEKIVTQMEEGQVPLAEAVALYERGAHLQAFCEKCLEEARLKVEKVTFKAETDRDEARSQE